MKKYSFYWDSISEKISQLIKKYIQKDMAVLEIGVGNTHFLEWMHETGYKSLHGIEIRQDEFLRVYKRFEEKSLNKIELFCEDVLEHNKSYDAIFSTRLIQCLDNTHQKDILKHVSKMAHIAVFVVPEIIDDRNMNSDIVVGVTGTKEFKTGNLPYELSKYYDSVRIGRINKATSSIKKTSFIYFVCKNLKE